MLIHIVVLAQHEQILKGTLNPLQGILRPTSLDSITSEDLTVNEGSLTPVICQNL